MKLISQHIFIYGLIIGLFVAGGLGFAIFAFIARFWHKRTYRAQILLYGAFAMVGYALFSIYAIESHVNNIEAVFPSWVLFLGKVSMPIALYLNTKLFIGAIPIQSLNAFLFWHEIKPTYYLVDAVYLITFITLFFITDPATSVVISMILAIITSISGWLFANNALKRLSEVYRLTLPFLVILQLMLVVLFLSTDSTTILPLVFVYSHLLISIFTTICAVFFIGYLSTNKNVDNSTSMLSNTETLYADILSAIKNDFLFLEYQPQISVTGEKIVGLEALVRLNHPKKGTLSPDSFIPIAEQSELINHISKWVINQAIKDAKILFTLGKTIPIAINFSVKDMKSEMIEYLIEGLHEQQVPQELITIEVTESLILDMTPEQQQALTMIKESQINISLDDFSAGFSSLRYIDELGLDELKIDKDLTLKLLEKNKRIIVSMIINMCDELGIKVVAEGVEDDEVFAILKTINCHTAQGYGICRPKRLEDLLDWCKEEGSEFCDNSCYC